MQFRFGIAALLTLATVASAFPRPRVVHPFVPVPYVPHPRPALAPLPPHPRPIVPVPGRVFIPPHP